MELLDISVCTNNSCNYFYRPQRSWGKVMFLQASVILLTGGGVPHPPGADTPQSTHPLEHTPPHIRPSREQTPHPQTIHPPPSPGADTPQPPKADTPPPGAYTPTPDHTPPPGADTPQTIHPLPPRSML